MASDQEENLQYKESNNQITPLIYEEDHKVNQET